MKTLVIFLGLVFALTLFAPANGARLQSETETPTASAAGTATDTPTSTPDLGTPHLLPGYTPLATSLPEAKPFRLPGEAGLPVVLMLFLALIFMSGRRALKKK